MDGNKLVFQSSYDDGTTIIPISTKAKSEKALQQFVDGLSFNEDIKPPKVVLGTFDAWKRAMDTERPLGWATKYGASETGYQHWLANTGAQVVDFTDGTKQILINPYHLAKTPKSTLTMLLHEVTHAYGLPHTGAPIDDFDRMISQLKNIYRGTPPLPPEPPITPPVNVNVD